MQHIKHQHHGCENEKYPKCILVLSSEGMHILCSFVQLNGQVGTTRYDNPREYLRMNEHEAIYRTGLHE